MLDAFRNSGVNLEQVKRKSDLKYFDIKKVDSYVPAKILEGFLHNLYRSQGLEHLDGQLIDEFNLYDMGEFGEFLTSLPDALSMINESIKLEPLITSNCRSQLRIKGIESFYYWDFANTLTAGRMVSEEFCLFMVLSGLQLALGANFPITSIHIPRYNYKTLKENLPEGNYELKFTENHYAVGFPTKMLTLLRAYEGSDFQRPMLPNGSFRSKVTQLFEGLEEGVMPSLDLLAMQSDISTRGLNRHLTNEGTNFRELLNIHLLNRALFYLEQTNHPIEYISQALGYHHVSNFIRAFKNWTGVSPLNYRSSLTVTG